MASPRTSSYRSKHSLEKRRSESRKILHKYPERIPVIVERHERSELPEIEKQKFLVPGNMLCGEFKYIVHKSIFRPDVEAQSEENGQDVPIKHSFNETIYIFVWKNIVPKTGDTMNGLYDKFKDEDGFL
ncbi:autophagy 8i, putative [Perkinsus marinus ATCC 50983]|uniref:Autophagy-related protein n=1 Tax=Perkinsus marinus (strain ATCC 50983 / TXsc) TaxID=423536 RepID=C5LVH9_PERM5|nr:autophagy 8i, putative [Perkinsus marinus ATCC 50983]EEQ99266.1 autophagy 8i, putative [Perkinsus marinus ATCC 50983]|eukprot:XP_002766549.1 autophagy 8i, putative [Perkinsus marinus ATCC 50983]